MRLRPSWPSTNRYSPLAEVFKEIRASDDEVVLVGLLDMVLASGGGPFIHDFLTRTDKYAVYHYLVTRLIARPTRPILAGPRSWCAATPPVQAGNTTGSSEIV